MKYDNLTSKKQKLDLLRPFPQALLKNLEEWFRTELTFTSNAIEGNTLTRQETALVIEKGLTIGGKTLNEHLEAKNHAQAFDWICEFIHSSKKNISEEDILEIHRLVLKGIDDENAGKYRNVSVRIVGYRVVFPNYLKVPGMINDFVEWLNSKSNMHPVEIATLAHYRLVSIHPFTDGNGRTARLLMNLILMKNRYPCAIIHHKDRAAYLSSLEQAQLGGSLEGFEKIIIKVVNRSLDIYLKAVLNKEEAIKPQGLMKIGELASATAESVSTLRYWTKMNLLPVTEYTAKGYQLYDSGAIARVKRIRELQEKRLTLEEIQQILVQDDDSFHD